MNSHDKDFERQSADLSMKIIRILGRPSQSDETERASQTRREKKVSTRNLSRKVGLEPGSIVYVGDERCEEAHVDVIDYSATDQDIQLNVNVGGLKSVKHTPNISWINIKGIHDSELVRVIGKTFAIDNLVLEDIANTSQRPKIEESDDYMFLSIKLLYMPPGGGRLKTKQVSLVFGDSWLLSFQESGRDIFEPVRVRLLKTVPRERFMSAGYLACALVDAIVDNYFVLLERIRDSLEGLNNVVPNVPKPQHLAAIRELNEQLIYTHEVVDPLREVIGGLGRADSKYLEEHAASYVRDIHEHVVQTLDTTESYRDIVTTLFEVYNMRISMRMAQFLKVMLILVSILTGLLIAVGLNIVSQ